MAPSEAAHSTTSSTEDKIEWNYTCVIRERPHGVHGDNLTFYVLVFRRMPSNMYLCLSTSSRDEAYAVALTLWNIYLEKWFPKHLTGLTKRSEA